MERPAGDGPLIPPSTFIAATLSFLVASGRMSSYYQSRTSAVYGVTISLTVLATLLVVARLIARRMSVAKLWWDDLALVAALSFVWVLSALYWSNIKHGEFGRHSTITGGPVGPDKLEIYFKYLLAVELTYFASAVSIKTSLILLYYRIFGVIRWFRLLLTVVWTIVLLNFLVCVFVGVFECNPIRFFWDRSIENGNCINVTQFYRWNGVTNLLLDCVIWSLTLPVIWHLNMNTRQKTSLSAVFVLGLLACIASVVRIVAFSQFDPKDSTYTSVKAAVWTIVEQAVGVICACLPTTRPLFGHLLHSIKNISSHGTNSGQATHSQEIPLSHYGSRPTVNVSIGSTKDGFARLIEENTVGVGSVTAHASKAASGDLPIVTHGITKHQRLEQRVEDRLWV